MRGGQSGTDESERRMNTSYARVRLGEDWAAAAVGWTRQRDGLRDGWHSGRGKERYSKRYRESIEGRRGTGNKYKESTKYSVGRVSK